MQIFKRSYIYTFPPLKINAFKLPFSLGKKEIPSQLLIGFSFHVLSYTRFKRSLDSTEHLGTGGRHGHWFEEPRVTCFFSSPFTSLGDKCPPSVLSRAQWWLPWQENLMAPRWTLHLPRGVRGRGPGPHCSESIGVQRLCTSIGRSHLAN